MGYGTYNALVWGIDTEEAEKHIGPNTSLARAYSRPKATPKIGEARSSRTPWCGAYVLLVGGAMELCSQENFYCVSVIYNARPLDRLVIDHAGEIQRAARAWYDFRMWCRDTHHVDLHEGRLLFVTDFD